MVDRRNVMKIGVTSVVGGVVNLSGQAFAAAIQVRPNKALLRAVYDDRFQQSQAFAEQFYNEGVPTSIAGEDIASLWYDDLRVHLLQKGLAPLTGLTDRATLFCLEELVRDVGMKVVFRIDHLINGKGQIRHISSGTDELAEMVSKLNSVTSFGQQMSTLIKHHAIHEPASVSAQKITGPFSPEKQTALVSWLIA